MRVHPARTAAMIAAFAAVAATSAAFARDTSPSRAVWLTALAAVAAGTVRDRHTPLRRRPLLRLALLVALVAALGASMLVASAVLDGPALAVAGVVAIAAAAAIHVVVGRGIDRAATKAARDRRAATDDDVT